MTIERQLMIFAGTVPIPIGTVLYPGMAGVTFRLSGGDGEWHDQMAVKVVREAIEAEYLSQGVNLGSLIYLARCKASNTPLYYYELQVD